VVDCQEDCDEGPFNGAPNGACNLQCREAPPALRIPGGGSRTIDCAVEWAMPLNPTRLEMDRRGLPRNRQACVEGDPSCDFDPSPGSCGFRLFACLGGGDARFACAPTAITSIEVVRPRPADGSPARAALLAAFQAVGFPVGPGEVCSRRVDVPVATGTQGRVATRARLATRKFDGDTLKLKCLPAP
jgi:hypothetical protein